MGFQILLVDDEELAIRGIEKGVNWDRIHIDKVFKAHSVATAERMLLNYSIDILLTDIEMPGGTGLELLRWVRENFPRIMCMFYTCHAEFSYAQEAIRLGVRDYLLKPVPYEELEQIILRMTEAYREETKTKEITDIWKDLRSVESEETAVDIVKRFIMDNIDADLQREELGRLVHMNPDYLSRLFKKQEGCAPAEYIANKRHALAKQLLKNTDLTVADIGSRIGMAYSSYFIRTFKKKEGITPQQYRDQCLKEASQD